MAERSFLRASKRDRKRSEGFCLQSRESLAAPLSIVVVTMCILKLKLPPREMISLLVFQSNSVSAGRKIGSSEMNCLSAVWEFCTSPVLTLSSSTTKGVAAVMLQYESRQYMHHQRLLHSSSSSSLIRFTSNSGH
ncbi:hypothetical protein DL95DRAFT_385159 [Leptodontidium sp. 2 PMI_412]|nr:hypothetical protein DL95DRAFT_385159 [Leptodontidium sp. 2 PMI_412]